MPIIRENKIETVTYTKLTIIFLMSLFFFVTIRGVSSNFNQERLKLEKEIHSLTSSNEWIKYEINDKISLDNLEKYALEVGMKEVTKEQIEVVIIDKNKINPASVITEKKEESFFYNIKRAIGELLNG